MSQMPIPKTGRVCCPIWASRVYREPLDASTGGKARDQRAITGVAAR